jgi:4a-hydroxytetrahydrobiopterin dehydratase
VSRHDPVPAADVAADQQLADWRVLLQRMEATFRAGSFEAAAAFAAEAARLADAADHHPDLDVRYPGIVHVVLTTHVTGGLSTADVELGLAISRLAAGAGLGAEPHAATTIEVAIDALDIAAVRPFWKAVLGYVDDRSNDAAQALNAIVDPRRIGPPFWFQQMDAPRPQRNRIHLDVTVPADIAEARIAAALEAGGTLVSDAAARAFWVLADPEGNEACICTWQDRD